MGRSRPTAYTWRAAAARSAWSDAANAGVLASVSARQQVCVHDIIHKRGGSQKGSLEEEARSTHWDARTILDMRPRRSGLSCVSPHTSPHSWVLYGCFTCANMCDRHAACAQRSPMRPSVHHNRNGGHHGHTTCASTSLLAWWRRICEIACPLSIPRRSHVDHGGRQSALNGALRLSHTRSCSLRSRPSGAARVVDV